jgi:hypothetical protein
MLKREKTTTKYDLIEPDTFHLELNECTAFANIIRVGLKTLVPIKYLYGTINNFNSTDPGSNFNFFFNQFSQIRIDAKQEQWTKAFWYL